MILKVRGSLSNNSSSSRGLAVGLRLGCGFDDGLHLSSGGPGKPDKKYPEAPRRGSRYAPRGRALPRKTPERAFGFSGLAAGHKTSPSEPSLVPCCGTRGHASVEFEPTDSLHLREFGATVGGGAGWCVLTSASVEFPGNSMFAYWRVSALLSCSLPSTVVPPAGEVLSHAYSSGCRSAAGCL